MLNISSLELPNTINSVYEISIDVNYTSNYDPIQFDIFQSGVLANISKEEVNVTIPGFKFLSNPPLYQNSSFSKI
jgi:hypothetical protein